MSAWATRCNACGTAFRVAEEQLAASEGYVRCGKCDAVFNARSTLFDLEPVQDQPADDTHSPLAAHGDSDALAAATTDSAPLASEPSIPPEPDGLEPIRAPSAADPVWVESPVDSIPDQARAEPAWSAAPDPDPVPAMPADPNARMLDLLGAAVPAAQAAGAATAAPGAAEWPSLRPPAPRRRQATAGRGLVGGVLVGLLAVALPLQWVWIERDALRARWPAFDAALLQHWPSLPSAGWQRLEGLGVLSSALKATPQGGAYQLELVLHNRAPHPLAMPWLDLSLADAQGRALLRRALEPSALGSSAPLRPGEQRRLAAVFRVDKTSAAVTGYEIGLFHP